MRAKQILRPIALLLAVLFAAACSAGPPPVEIARARLAIQDAKNANADQRAARDYDAAIAHFSVAQNTWNEKKDGPTAAHWARLAEAEARQAQARAELGAAEEDLRLQTDRKQRGELAVRDAEIMSLQARARSEAEKRAAEAEARAAEERRRTEGDLARREAGARETERIRSEAEARLVAERQRAESEAAQRSQAERDRIAADLDKMKAELERTRQEAEAARRVAEAGRQQLEQQREAEASRAAELERARRQQQQTEDALKKTLSQLGQVREEARGLILTLPGSIYFDVNRSELKPSMRDRLTQIARALATAPDRHVLVEGHTDSDGSSEYNLKLSRLRAESVRSILIVGGVAPGRIESQGYGKTRPVASNATAAGKAQNRRVEVVVQGSSRPTP
jgi:outer membrane protein OmpA-like peptidoglycan-associated protein